MPTAKLLISNALALLQVDIRGFVSHISCSIGQLGMSKNQRRTRLDKQVFTLGFVPNC